MTARPDPAGTEPTVEQIEQWLGERPVSGKPSPYVSIYVSRRQAEAARAALLWMAEGRAKSNPLWRFLACLDEALSKNAGEAS